MRRAPTTRVVHVSSAHPVTDPRVHLREAASLAAAGYDVTLVAVDTDRHLPGDTGVRVIRLPQLPRLYRMTGGSARAIWTAVRTGAQVVHLHDPELIWAVPLLRGLRKTVIFDAHEDLPNQVFNKAYLNPRLQRIAARVMNVLIRIASRSHLIVAATETVAERYPADRVCVVRNYPIIRAADSDQPAGGRSSRVAYLGALSPERGAAQMVDAFARPEFPADWSAIFAGSMPSSLLSQLEQRPGWEKVDYRGFLPADEARDLLNDSTVGLVVLQRSRAYLDSLPTKMFEYFAAGIPVVASDFPLWRQIIETHDCGLLVDETDPSQIAGAISTYASNPELLARHGMNARRAAEEELNWASQGRLLVGAYDRLCRQ